MSSPVSSLTAGESIRRHSRSFSFASRLLPAGKRADVELLYAWCRWCDDGVDTAASPQQALEFVERATEDFRRIVRDEKINPLLKKGWKKVRESMKVKGTTSAGRNVSVPQMPQAEYEKLSAASKEAVNKHLKSIRDSLKA